MSRDTASFRESLRQLRQAAALSQEELAERAGLSLRGISDLERGVRRAPHLTTVRLLADALALSPADRDALLAAARPVSAAGHACGRARSHPPRSRCPSRRSSVASRSSPRWSPWWGPAMSGW